MSCQNLTDFPANHCEMINPNAPPCSGPMDCLNGNVCCYQTTLNLISCQKDMACSGDGVDTWIICTMDSDCPTTTSGTCMIYGTNPATGTAIGYCWPMAASSPSGQTMSAP
jgi:hypothetical protein